VESDMTLQHFPHEAVQGATTGGHELKHPATFVLAVERAFNSFHLTPNPPNPTEEFHLVLRWVCHRFLI
jgi:hypothetical protein